jgi:outer membrane immunogenic protein
MGMRAILTGFISLIFIGPSVSADYTVGSLPRYDDLVETTPLYAGSPWSRPYIGLLSGVSAADRNYILRIPGASDTSVSITGGGLDLGIRMGYDHEQDNFLVGAAADFSFTGIRSAITGSVAPLGLSASLESRTDNLGTLRIRAGYLAHRNVLAYVHGGGAVAKVSILENGAPIPEITDQPRFGYVVGGGVEYAVGDSITLNTEYSYLNFGEVQLRNYGVSSLYEAIASHRLTSGVNIRF